MPTGPGDVLELIRRGEVRTRSEILEHTGLSRMTVSHRVDALLDAGLLLERPNPTATGGRRARTLQFNTAHARVAVATVNTTHLRTALTDLGGRVLDDDHLDIDLTTGPDPTLAAVARSWRDLLAGAGGGEGPPSGLGISLPGPVDPSTGRPSQPPLMPRWDAFPIAEHLGAAIPGVPVLCANDADAAAVGEHALGHPRARALCLVKVDTGIGSGIVIDGRPYPGSDGGSGDIGHIRLGDWPAAACQCGASGCLAAVASGRAIARELTRLGVPARTGRDVGALLAAGNTDAVRLTQQAGRRIGAVLATMVSVLNPDVVVVGGALASAPLLAGIRETLYRLTLPRATRHLTLELGTLGDDAAVTGLARMVVERQYGAEEVNRRLAPSSPATRTPRAAAG